MKKQTVIIIVVFVILIGGYFFWNSVKTDHDDISVINDNKVITGDKISSGNVNVESISSQEQMLDAARVYVAENSVEGLEFNLAVTKALNNWSLLVVVPTNAETDEAMVVLEKVDDLWIVRGFGTSLPDLEEEIPDLFE